MKTYGAMKATEFSKKQIGVIYRNAKAGTLKVETWMMNMLYRLADYYSYDDNGSVADSERQVLRILDKVFAGEMAEAQTIIDEFTAHEFDLLSNKAKKAANREMIA
jgi:hypothetical protein